MHIAEKFPWVDRTSWDNNPFNLEIFDSQFDNLFPNNKISVFFKRIGDFLASVLTKEKTSKDPQKNNSQNMYLIEFFKIPFIYFVLPFCLISNILLVRFHKY